MAKTQKNKATMSHLCMLKAQLAQLRRQEIELATKGSGGGGEGWDVKATGENGACLCLREYVQAHGRQRACARETDANA